MSRELEPLTPQEEQRILVVPRCLVCAGPVFISHRDTPDVCERCREHAKGQKSA